MPGRLSDQSETQANREHIQTFQQPETELPLVQQPDPRWVALGCIESQHANESAPILIKYDPHFEWKIDPHASWEICSWGALLWKDLVPHICWCQATIDVYPAYFDENRHWAKDVPRDDKALDRILKENYDTCLAIQKESMRNQEENVFQKTFSMATEGAEVANDGQDSLAVQVSQP